MLIADELVSQKIDVNSHASHAEEFAIRTFNAYVHKRQGARGISSITVDNNLSCPSGIKKVLIPLIVA